MSRTTYAEWHERGKELYTQKQYESANVAFQRALACLQQQDTEAVTGTPTSAAAAAPSAEQCQLLLDTLQGLSLAQIDQKFPKDALLCAAATAALSCYSSGKAFNCASLALDDIARDQLSSSSAVQYAELQEAALLLSIKAGDRESAHSALAGTLTNMAEADVWRVVCSCIGASTAELMGLVAAAVRGAAASDGDADTAAHDDDSSSTSSSSEDVRWLKLGGQEAYRRGNFEEAVEMFQIALRQLQNGPTAAAAASTLLSNQAACLLQLNQRLGQAAINAVAAAMIGGAGASQTKALYRAASAMLQLRLLPAAAAVCKLGLSTAPEEQVAAMRELQQRICKQQQQGAAKASNTGTGSSSANAGASGSSSSSSTRNRSRQSSAGAKVLIEREAERYMSAAAGGSAGLQQMAAMNAAASMAAATGRGLRWMTGPDNRVPAFYDEYIKAKRCDAVSVMQTFVLLTSTECVASAAQQKKQ
jgi:tetratricopeptide (TPR) repeat protein